MIDSINKLLIAPWTTSVVFTAIRLKIFTVISNRMMSAKDIASMCEANEKLLKPLLDACVSMELLISHNNQYKNSSLSIRYLIEGEPNYVGDLIELQYDESNQWDKLYDIILSKHEEDKEKRTEEDKLRTFIKGMNNLGMLGEAEALKNSVDLSGCKKMIDAGGGSGLYSVVLCQKYPELNVTILDRKETFLITEEMIEGEKEKDRITLREADILKDSFGSNIDAVLLSDVMYDESEARMILGNARNCLRTNGLLIIRGYYSDPENTQPLFGAIFILNLLVFNKNSDILTISSLQTNVTEAGFKISKVSPLTEKSFIILARKK